MTTDWPTVRERIADRTARVLSDLNERWGPTRTIDSFDFGPKPYYPDEPPRSVDGQLTRIAGIASVVLFYTSSHEQTVLVYNYGGFWEPPGGVTEKSQTPEEAARAEAREETGLEIELTGLLYAGTFEFHYANGASVPLPVAQFVGHRVDGTLTVERERIDHPGATRATGLFDTDVFPEQCRDGDEIRRLLAESE
ncbi:NUDIX domain-containing protein [Haloferax namakaokahaiae]|uniref:NUDIX domain-containing protein n=1 Tax=Haloferax namakaokahaiae TaxID=1748331 RepID=A0ABD5ZJW8_9EURY